MNPPSLFDLPPELSWVDWGVLCEVWVYPLGHWIWRTERTKKEPLDPFCLQFLLLSFQQSGPWIDQKQRWEDGGWKFKQGTSLPLRPWKGLPWHTMRRFPRPHGHSFESRDGRLSMHFFWLSAILGVRQSNETCPAYICILYIGVPTQPQGEKNRSNLRDSVMPLLCRELDGGFNSVEKYYFPKVCCENPESSKPPTREKTTQRIYNSWFSQMLLLGICKCRFFSLENFLNFVLQEFLHVSIWPRRDGLLHLKNCLEHIKVPHCVQPLTQKTLQRFLVAMEAP